MVAKQILKTISLPWHTKFLAVPNHATRPFFGLFPKKIGGPDLKIQRLERHFGNYWFNHNLLYVLSGKPIPLTYLQMAKNRGCKVIFNQDGVYFPAWFKGDYEKKNRCLKSYHELADFVIYQSQFCFESAKEFIRPPERPHEIIHNGVDINRFALKPQRQEGRPFRILAAAYFNSSKEYLLEFVLNVAKKIKEEGFNATVLIAGQIEHGPKQLKTLAKKIGITEGFQYLGPYSWNRFPSILAEADIFLHCVFNDACPNAVLEAMAVGLPVVYGDSGGTRELVGEGGLAVPVSRSFESVSLPPMSNLIQAIQQACNTYADLSAKARRRTEELFSERHWLERHRHLMAGMMTNGRRHE